MGSGGRHDTVPSGGPGECSEETSWLGLTISGSSYQLQDNYEVLCLIGQGSFGKVFVGRHCGTRKRVTMKELKKAEGQAAYMATEIAILKGLRHPNITQLLESKRQRLQEKDALSIFRDILGAVNYCHRQGIVHGDLKPENVLINTYGRAKVCDFGFAFRFIPRQEIRAPGGMPAYFAPERLLYRTYEGPPLDVWALGVILYKMNTGTRLFCGEPPEINDTIIYGIVCYPDFIPMNVKYLIGKIMNRSPKWRPTAQELVLTSQAGPAAPILASEKGPAAPSLASDTVPAANSMYYQPGPAAPRQASRPGPAAPSLASETGPAAPSLAFETGPAATSVYNQPVPAAPSLSSQPASATPSLASETGPAVPSIGAGAGVQRARAAAETLARRSETSPAVLPPSGTRRTRPAARRNPGSPPQIQSRSAPRDDVTESTWPAEAREQESREHAQPQKHWRGGRRLALLYFRPPVPGELGQQRGATLEAHPKSSHALRPEMTSRSPRGLDSTLWDPPIVPRSRSRFKHAHSERSAYQSETLSSKSRAKM
ncbi:sperm motility kinase 2A [Fukomys damarensis]|uniref:sperm motility kinase 2A n=1 Tax=Fukomys damarensis TaxID=885580 RepID=UPI0008FEC77C|nr:sperm motility kinase 2A [Fukomys damarensis]